MTGLRCPNCGFYNLSARAKCARCGKALPELTPEQKGIFPEDEASASGLAFEPDTESPPEKSGPEIISPSQEELKPEAEPKEVASAPAWEEPGSEPSSVLEAEIISSAEGGSKDATMPKEYQPEVPSFDESVISKIDAEAELGELSHFFKDVKKKPEPEPEPKELSQVKLAEAPEGEESLSQIGIEKEPESTPSFKPDFKESLFPQFGPESEEKPGIESSESAVSAPLSPGKLRIISGGLIDLVLYLIIAGLLIKAGQGASGILLSDFSYLEVFRYFVLPVCLALMAIVWFYQIFFLSVLGQSLGGMMMGLEILDHSGKRPRVLRASLRALIYVLCLLPLGLGFLPTIFGNSLPDRIAKTKLVRW